jgi:hypothetical protein
VRPVKRGGAERHVAAVAGELHARLEDFGRHIEALSGFAGALRQLALKLQLAAGVHRNAGRVGEQFLERKAAQLAAQVLVRGAGERRAGVRAIGRVDLTGALDLRVQRAQFGLSRRESVVVVRLVRLSHASDDRRPLFDHVTRFHVEVHLGEKPHRCGLRVHRSGTPALGTAASRREKVSPCVSRLSRMRMRVPSHPCRATGQARPIGTGGIQNFCDRSRSAR